MEASELIGTALRGAGVYVFMLVLLRLMGKREVGNFTAFDLLVALMLGEVVDEIIYGDVSLAQGGVAILVIAMAQYATGWVSYLAPSSDRLLEGVPTPIIKNGKLLRDGMRKERLNRNEVMGLLREQDVQDVREVKLALLEVDGEMSVLKHDWAEPLQKADLGGEAAAEKRKHTGGSAEPPETKRTYSKEALAGAA